MEKMQCLTKEAFPKVCPTCHKVYSNELEFFTETVALENTDREIKAVEGLEENQEPPEFIEVYRNCACGTTLMEWFHSRRNFSEKGIKQRLLFTLLQEGLISKGYSVDDARGLILDFMDIVLQVEKQRL
ncbi:MAG: hypothetical protein KDI30_02985 [Pseudomonadales bacterium]|nr:hypothetical protein [Pseudomonadales bacterium]